MEKHNLSQSEKYYKDDDYYIDETAEVKEIIYDNNIFAYGWGRNRHGELGQGCLSESLSIGPIESLKSLKITQISAGGKHTLALNDEGKIFSCGNDVLNLLGLNDVSWKESPKFIAIDSLANESIIQLACAEFHSICLSKEGVVFTWGGNLHSKLGLVNLKGGPMKVGGLKKIIKVSCGDYHSVALAESGEVFSWGGGGKYNRGQCGHGDLKDVETPRRIESLKSKRITNIACGGYHTLVYSSEDELYGFGRGDYGQLGYGKSEDSTTPKPIRFSKRYAQYESDMFRYTKDATKFNKSNKNLLNLSYTDSLGNLNNNFKDPSTSSLKKQNPIIIKDIKCGGHHSVLLSKFGHVYAFGHNYNGQLGLNDTKNYDRPMLVKTLLNKVVNQIAAGWSHTLILTNSGDLYATGYNKSQELGLNNDKEARKIFTHIKNISQLNITQIFAGGHHSFCIIDSIYPERLEYNSPSPLASLSQFNTPDVSGNNSPRNNNKDKNDSKSIFPVNLGNNSSTLIFNKTDKTNPKLKLNLDLLYNQSNNNIENDCTLLATSKDKTILTLAYSELDKCHRFIRFSLTPNKAKKYKKDAVKSMIENFLSKDKGVIMFRLQDDNTDVNEINNEALNALFKDFKEKLLVEINNKQSYSLNIIYDQMKLESINEVINKISFSKNNNSHQKETENFYEMIELTKEIYESSSSLEQLMSSWVFDFLYTFKDFFDDNFEKPRFLELRPKLFNIYN